VRDTADAAAAGFASCLQIEIGQVIYDPGAQYGQYVSGVEAEE
jgi:hypothetical protein